VMIGRFMGVFCVERTPKKRQAPVLESQYQVERWWLCSVALQ
jgi:hypothetical protein